MKSWAVKCHVTCDILITISISVPGDFLGTFGGDPRVSSLHVDMCRSLSSMKNFPLLNWGILSEFFWMVRWFSWSLEFEPIYISNSTGLSVSSSQFSLFIDFNANLKPVDAWWLQLQSKKTMLQNRGIFKRLERGWNTKPKKSQVS